MPEYVLRASLKESEDCTRDLLLRPGDVENRGCWELCELIVFAPAGDGWDFLVDDEPLSLSHERSWCWKPGFYAGLVKAELRRHQQPVASYRLEVSPAPEKLALSLYQRMLDELIEIDPVLVIGTEPAGARLGALGAESDQWVEFRRLRMYAPHFVSAMRQLSKRPIRTVRSSRRTAPLRVARRVDVQTVRSAAMMGAIGPLVGDTESVAHADRQSESVYDLPWYEEHFDGPANRCVTAMLLAVRRRAVSLFERLARAVEQADDSDTRTGLANRWPSRRAFLEKLIWQLKGLARAQPFRSVTQPEISAAGLNAISAHPVYARAYRKGWHAIRPGLQGTNAAEAIWLCPTWELYERWCFGQVVKQLRTVTGEAGTIRWHDESVPWNAEMESGVRIRAYVQRTFGSTQTAEFHSISRERRPDIVITAEFEGKRRYLVLDAKYTQCRRGALREMAAAHIYHDSLRWGGERPWRTLLTVPAGGGAPWLEEESFIEFEGVGVLVLSPEAGVEQLSSHLLGLIDNSP